MKKGDSEFLELISELFFEKCNCKVCICFRKIIFKEFNRDGTWKK